MAATHYDVLGVARDASAAEVRQAFVRAARRHHPDRHMADDDATRREAERAMREVNEAWAVLGDGDRRRDYDRRLGLGTPPVQSRSTGPTFSAGSSPASSAASTPQHRDWRAYAAPGSGAATPRSVGEQLLMLSPLLFLVTAGAAGLAGAVVGWPPFFGLAMISLICTAVAFFMLPIWAMSRAGRRGGASRKRPSYVASRRATIAGDKRSRHPR